MNMKDYLKELASEEKGAFARCVGCSVGYLQQIARGERSPSDDLTKRLIEASGGTLTVEHLRPAIFELVHSEIKKDIDTPNTSTLTNDVNTKNNEHPSGNVTTTPLPAIQPHRDHSRVDAVSYSEEVGA